MKFAMTLDGKIACFTGNSKWITGEEARQRVQQERLRHTGIMVGVGTVLADDPMLTCRIEGGRDPVRIVCDSHLRAPLESNIVRTAREVPTIIATLEEQAQRSSAYTEKGCKVLFVKEKDGRLDLDDLMEQLGKMRIDSILLEGGGTLNWSALRAGIVSKVQAYIAPKIFGGAGKSPVEGEGVPEPDLAFMLSGSNIVRIGQDFLIESTVEKQCSQD